MRIAKIKTQDKLKKIHCIHSYNTIHYQTYTDDLPVFKKTFFIPFTFLHHIPRIGLSADITRPKTYYINPEIQPKKFMFE